MDLETDEVPKRMLRGILRRPGHLLTQHVRDLLACDGLLLTGVDGHPYHEDPEGLSKEIYAQRERITLQVTPIKGERGRGVGWGVGLVAAVARCFTLDLQRRAACPKH